MSILNIRPAVLGVTKPILAIAGPQGSGKTYTALKVARGMVSHPSKLGFLDTENGRGSLYAKILDGSFMIGDLYAPFSPQRYSEAIKEFISSGIEALVIDSGSHEWEGEGGCDDIAQAPLLAGKNMANWKGAKKYHKGFMNTILYSNIPIICCLRAREKTDFTNPNKPVSLGIQPICEKNFMYEMTASLLMENEGRKQTFLKMPYFLKPFFGDGNGYLGEETGRKIMEWFNAGEKEDPEVTKCKSDLLMACELGIAGLTALWNHLSPALQKKMKPHFSIYKESAKAYDEQAKQATETPQDALADTLNNLNSQGKQAALNMP